LKDALAEETEKAQLFDNVNLLEIFFAKETPQPINLGGES